MTTIAIIGCGRIAQNAHIPPLAEMENVRIKYACDLIESKAQAMKEKYPSIENVITDYKVALADPEVEAVWVLTPNYAHYTVTMDALAAGKHVMCEKPITVNYELSCEMAKAANERGLMLNIGVCNRHHRSVELIRERVERGDFGKLYHIYCSFRAFRSIPGLGGPFTDKAQSGGGVLIDWGVHYFDLILYILGGAKLRTVTADAYCEMAKDMKAYKYRGMWAEDTKDTEGGVNDVDDFITGYIRTDKASISFNGAWAQNVDIDDTYIDFLGDKGGARLDYCAKYEFWNGETLEHEVPEYELGAMYKEEDEAFIESIESGVKDRNHIDFVLESAKLLQALYDSAEARAELNFKE
ncbi:MAG: Gfo/Idh/MocA family oxidoreductase [Clostridia bacterium]|nr:Gfo/Idh/MocA family oxidoreductase [Clostridia bacterium]